MKNKILLLIIMVLLVLNVSASSGNIRQSSVFECNGRYYGNHGSPIHWHIVEKQNGKWVSISKEVGVPSCYMKPLNTKEQVIFNSCVDGDTAKFIIHNEVKTVRFLAIDTPEVGQNEEVFGKEASNYTCNTLKQAQSIYLEYDGNSDKEDKYGRVLAFVFTDNELLEAKLVKEGLAKVAYIYGDYAYVEELRELENEARKEEKGIWKKEINLPNEEDGEAKKEEKDSFFKDFFSFIIELLIKIFDLI